MSGFRPPPKVAMRAICLRAPLVFAITAMVFTSAAQTALGDTGVIANDPSLPWTDPNHHSPTEVLASNLASTIAGRTVSIRCEGDNDWANLGQTSDELGYVGWRANFFFHYVAQIDTFAQIQGSMCQAF